jgi:hypothetical protein
MQDVPFSATGGTTGGGFVLGRDVIDSTAVLFFLSLHQVFIEFSQYVGNILEVDVSDSGQS